MNIIDAQLLEILHKYKRNEISRAEAELEANTHREKIVVHFYDGGFTIRHLTTPATV